MPKKSVVSTTKTEEVNEVVDSVEVDMEKEELKKTNSLQSEQLLAMQQQMAEMQKLMAQMFSAKESAPVQQVQSKVEPKTRIRSYIIDGCTLMLDRDTPIRFDGFNSEIVLTYSEADRFIRYKKNKELFISGLLAFVDESDYEELNIKPLSIITDEKIAELLQMEDQEKLFKELNRITNNKTYQFTMHQILYRSAIVYKKRIAKNISMETMETYRDFFGVTITDIAGQLSLLENV